MFVVVSQMNVSGLYCYLATLAHSIPGIHDEIHNHLLKLDRVRPDRSEFRLQESDQFNILPDDWSEHGRYIGNHGVQVAHNRLQHLPAAKRKELAGKFRRALCGTKNLTGFVMELIPFHEAPEHELAIGDYRRKYIVEVVSYPTGQSSDRLDLLRLQKPVLELPALGDVEHITLDLDQLAAIVENGYCVLDDEEGSAIPPAELDFLAFEAPAPAQFSQQILPLLLVRVQRSRVALHSLLG
jgi:hypothetical protein